MPSIPKTGGFPVTQTGDIDYRAVRRRKTQLKPQGPEFNFEAFNRQTLGNPSHELITTLEPAEKTAKRMDAARELDLNPDLVLPGDAKLDDLLTRELRNKHLYENANIAQAFTKNKVNASLIQNDIDKFIELSNNPAIRRTDGVLLKIEGQLMPFDRAPTRDDFPEAKYGYKKAYEVYTKALVDYEQAHELRKIQISRNRDKEARGLGYDRLSEVPRTNWEGFWQPIFGTGIADFQQRISILIAEMTDYGGEEQAIKDFNKGRDPSDQIFFDANIKRGQRHAQMTRNTKKYPVPAEIREGMQEISKARTPGDWAIAVMKHPRAFLETFQRSFGSNLPQMGLMGLGIATGPSGSLAVAGLFSGLVEYAATIDQLATQYDYDTSNALDMANLFDDEEMMGIVRKQAVERGLTIGLFDLFTGGLSRFFVTKRLPIDLKKIKEGSIKSTTKTLAGTTAIEMTGGAAGEAAAQTVVAREPLHWGDIITEGVLGSGTSVATSVFGLADAEFSKRRYKAYEDAKATNAATNAVALNEAAEILTQTESLNLDGPSGRAAVKDVLNNIIDDDDVVSVSAEAYNQAVNQATEAGETIDMPGSVTEQLAAATETGGDVSMKKSDLLAGFAGTAAWETIVDNVRTNTESMTLTEARAHFGGDNTVINDAVNQAANETTRRTKAQSAQEVIYNRLLKSMGGLRIPSTQAQNHALVMSKFYVRNAEILRQDPLEYFQRIKPQFADRGPTQHTFNQEINSDATWFGNSRAVDGDGAAKPVISISEENKATRYEEAGESAPEGDTTQPTYVLSVQNPFTTPFNAINDPDLMAQHLIGQGVLVADDVTRLREQAENNEQLAALLKQEVQNAGYDSFSYAAQDGSEAFVPFNDGQVMPLQNAEELNQTAFHGTTAQFDQFDLDYTDPTGVHGWGLYFTNKKSLAETYANTGRDQPGRLLKVDLPENSEFIQRDNRLNDQGDAQPLVDKMMDALPEEIQSRFERFGDNVPSARDFEDLLKDHYKSEKIDAFTEGKLNFSLLGAASASEYASKFLNQYGFVGSLGRITPGHDRPDLVFVLWDERVVSNLEVAEQNIAAQEAYFQYAGVRATSAPMQTFGKAQEMLEAKTPRQKILEETGWTIGPDQQWRWEISDNVPYGPALERRLNQFDEMVAKYNEEADRADADRQKVIESLLGPDDPLPGKINRVEKSIPRLSSTMFGLPADDDPMPKLPEFLNHPELFTAYPWLRDIPVDVSDMGQTSLGAYVSNRVPTFISNNTMPRGTINVNSRLPLRPLSFDILMGKNTLKSVLLHEIQHAIQEYETFARGGNSRQAFMELIIPDFLATIDDTKVELSILKQDSMPLQERADKLWARIVQGQFVEDVQKLREYSLRDNPGRVWRHIRAYNNLFSQGEFYRLYRVNYEDRERGRALESRGNEINNLRQPKKDRAIREWAADMADFIDPFITQDTRDFYETHSDITPNKIIKEFLKNIRVINAQIDKKQQARLEQQIDSMEGAMPVLYSRPQGDFDDARVLKKLKENAGFRDIIYWKLFGEIEARNTQKRMLLTDEQRRVRLPEETQDTSATPIIAMGNNLITQAPEFYPQSSPAEVNRGAFDPRTLTITLLRNADASTMIHETGHLFFQTNMDTIKQLLALETLTETQTTFLNDMNVLFTHLGIKGPINEQILIFEGLSFDEKRFYHEKFAESWEAYAFEGKSPSIDLQRVFNRFKEFLKSVYQSLQAFIAQNPEAGDLSDEVRQIFNRMLASDEEIKLAAEAKSLMPLFESAEEAGMTAEGYEAYLEMNEEARLEAVQQLDEKSNRDLKYLSRARAEKIRKLQKEARAKRRTIRTQARLDILGESIYQAYQFLTNKIRPEDKIDQLDPPPQSKDGEVDYEVDTLFVAIAKLGGLNKKLIEKEWGYDPENKSIVFKRKPVVRVRGGLTPDAMVEALAQYGYLELDENGKASMTDLEEKFMFSDSSGEDVYSSGVNHNFLNYDPQPGDQVVNPSALETGRFDYEHLVEMVGREKADKLKAMGMTAKNGLSAQMLAERFQFDSVEMLVNDLLESSTITEAVDALVDQRMIEQYAELSDQQSIEAAADRALANVARTRFVNTELNILGRALGKAKVAYQAAKMTAAQVLGRQKVKHIKPRNAFNAAARAGRAARIALKKGDSEQAYVEKMNQLVSTQLSEQGYKAKDRIEKALKYFRKFAKSEAAKRISADYLDAIIDVLSRFDLSTQSIRAADRKSAFSKFIIDQLDEGIIPEVPLNLFLTDEQRAQYQKALLDNPDMDDAQKAVMLSGFAATGVRKSYFDLTMDEFDDLVATVQQIEHLGRKKNQFLNSQLTRSVEEETQVQVDQINRSGTGRNPSNKTPVNFRGRAKQLAKRFGMSHVRVSTLAFIFDGGIDGGPAFNFLIRTATERSAYETDERAKATTQLLKIMEPIFANAKRFWGGMQKVRFWESVQANYTYEEIVVMALNFGNESNISRLTLNNELDEGQLRLLFKEALSESDWKAIQNIWTYLDSWRPQIGKQMRRIEGREPDWIVAMPFEIETKDGENVILDGGYFPVIYDPEASVQASDQDAKEQAKQLMSTGRAVQTTRRSFTKSRYEGEIKGRPLLLNMNGLFMGVSDVIHDLAWREWLIDFNRVYAKGPVANAIFANFGRETHDQIMRWREDIAKGHVSANGIDWMFGMLRRGVSAAGLGINIMNSILQTTGLLGTLTRVKGRYVMPELIRFFANPLRSTRDVKELSAFMRTRSKTRFRELREVMNVVEGKTRVTRTLQAATYFLMLQVQQVVDVISWNAAYRQHMAKSGDHETSRAVADQIIKDTQGSGEIMDLSQIERGNQTQKLFTVFYNYANTQLNMLIATKNMSEAGRMKKLWNLLLVAIAPVIAEQVIKTVLTPGEDEDYDPDDPSRIAKRLAGEYASYWLNMLVFLRELGYPVKAAMSGKWFGGYGGPSGTRVLSDAADFVNQASQGELDEAFVRSGISLGGSISGAPAAQINRTIKGTKAYIEGDTDNPTAVFFGYQGD